jgi:hypothetical protein
MFDIVFAYIVYAKVVGDEDSGDRPGVMSEEACGVFLYS